MEQNKVNTFAAKFKKAFSEAVLNELGKATRYCHRVRQLTPYRMVMTLMALLAGTRVESLADLQRGFNALFGFTMDYKPFYDQLAKREFATFMRETARRLLETLVIRVLGVAPGGAFSEFRRIVIQDGSSFAIKDALKEVFPGRFKKVKPAAVELHATLDLLDESLSKVTLTADTASERAALPKASSLGDSLLLADRGYFDRDYLSELTKAGASFVIRAPKGLNPKVLEAFDAKRPADTAVLWQTAQDTPHREAGAVDLQVRWEVPGQSLECRLIVAWNAATKEFQYLATNLPPGRYSVSEVAKAYRLRWQVELLFKEWKSYADLHAFDTQNPAIVEGLIWAAIGAAALKRFLAHTAQVVAGVETSTRKAAMCAVHVLQDILRTLISGIENRFLDAFARAIDYLAGNARRAHLNGIDNAGGCNSVWSRFSRILNYITYEKRLGSRASMTLLAGLLDVLLRGISLIAFATAVGGVAYVLWALRPLQEWTAHLAGFVQRALRLITGAAFTLAGVQALVVFVLHPWTLADEAGRWPLAALLHTDYARTGLITIALALCLGALGRTLMSRPRSRPLWIGAVALVLALLVNSAWLAHGVSRLMHREVLMAVTVLHVAGAAVWIGGLIHLAGFWQLGRREANAGGYGPVVLARFSDLAIASVALLVLPGLYLAWVYVGDLDGLIGTGYGVMVLTKVVLLLATLTLGGINLLLVKSWRRSWPDPGPARRIPALVEAEVGLGVTILLVAASLTSLPPSIDIGADRASPAEVMARFVPKLPRLASPPVQDLLASAGRIDDTLAERQPAEYAWSEYNHHMAGMFVFAMGLCALMERRRAARWARHWPLIFLGLAAFLFIRNDPRAWPLGPAGFWESMALPDVLQHRLVVGVLVALALFEWQVRTGRLQNLRWRLAFPLLCAAGGALILTHSHAMFNLKSEFLAEVSHAPLGVFAVLMGWGRWLELRLPEEDRRIPAWLWPVAFTLIGLTLLLYREI